MIIGADKQLADSEAAFAPLLQIAQQVQHASDFEANLKFAQLQRNTQRVHAQLQQAAVDSCRSFEPDAVGALQLTLSLSHLARHSAILSAEMTAELRPFFKGRNLKVSKCQNEFAPTDWQCNLKAAYSSRAPASASCPFAQAYPELLYLASRDGFRRDDLVRSCANKGSTLTTVCYYDSCSTGSGLT